MACYVERFEEAYGDTQVNRSAIFCEPFEAVWKDATDQDRKFLFKWVVALSVYFFTISTEILSTLPTLNEQEIIELWALVQKEHMTEGLLRFAIKKQEVREIFVPGALKLLAKKMVEDQQNQKSWSKILLQMNLFIRFFKKKYIKGPQELMEKLDLPNKCIDMTSSLGEHLLLEMSKWTANDAENYFIKYI